MSKCLNISAVQYDGTWSL